MEAFGTLNNVNLTETETLPELRIDDIFDEQSQMSQTDDLAEFVEPKNMSLDNSGILFTDEVYGVNDLHRLYNLNFGKNQLF